MQPDDMRLIVQTVEARGMQTPSLMPATVVGFETGASVVSLVVDGDPPDSVVEALPLFSDFANGDRVMVMFDPPQGVYVVGRIGVTANEPRAGELFKYWESDVINLTDTSPTAIAIQDDELGLLEGRAYRIDMQIYGQLSTDTNVGISASSTSASFPKLGSATDFVALGGWLSLNLLEPPFQGTSVSVVMTHGIREIALDPFEIFLNSSEIVNDPYSVYVIVKVIATDVGAAPPIVQSSP